MLDDFERTIDEFFDQILIERWRCGTGDDFESAEILEFPERYEVRLKTGKIDPAGIEIEFRGRSLTVRAPGAEGARRESTFELPGGVNPDAATARWDDGTLSVVVPKHQVRRISLKND